MTAFEVEVARVDDLVDGEMREVKVGEKKALLSRINGQFFATSHLCTHYKAQLVKGVLSEDGRVVCPWHGACFNVRTGDIEDAPGLDHLAKFDVRVADGKVFVTATEEGLAQGRQTPLGGVRRGGRADTSDARVFVILGGGAAGMVACETLREQGFGGRIVLVSKETYLPIDRVKLSKGLKIETDKVLLRPQSFFTTANIEVLLGKAVAGLSPASNTVTLDGGDVLKYDALLVATGANPRNFWPNSAAMANVIVLRGVDDTQKLDAALAKVPKPRIVTVGSSFIAMEAAATLVKVAQSVVVIGMEKVPFERVLGVKIGEALQKLHEEKNITFRMETVVDTFESADNGATCSGLKLKSGEVIPADIVIIGAGVVPATDAFKSALPLERDGSIVVTEQLRVAEHPNIYVAGDIARFPYKYNSGATDPRHLVRIEHWNVAQQHGRVAALNMLGGNVRYETVPFFWTTQHGKGLRYCGHALAYDDVHIDGSLSDLVFTAFFYKGEDILAVAAIGRDPEVSYAAELMRLGRLPTMSQIRSGMSLMDVPSCGKTTPNELKQRAAQAGAADARSIVSAAKSDVQAKSAAQTAPAARESKQNPVTAPPVRVRCTTE